MSSQLLVFSQWLLRCPSCLQLYLSALHLVLAGLHPVQEVPSRWVRHSKCMIQRIVPSFCQIRCPWTNVIKVGPETWSEWACYPSALNIATEVLHLIEVLICCPSRRILQSLPSHRYEDFWKQREGHYLSEPVFYYRSRCTVRRTKAQFWETAHQGLSEMEHAPFHSWIWEHLLDCVNCR